LDERNLPLFNGTVGVAVEPPQPVVGIAAALERWRKMVRQMPMKRERGGDILDDEEEEDDSKVKKGCREDSREHYVRLCAQGKIWIGKNGIK